MAASNARWYRAPTEDVGSELWSTVRAIADQTRWLRAKDRCHAELYECPGALRENTRGRTYESSSIGTNVVRQAVDTLTSIVSVERPLPQVYTSRGNWSQQKRARKASEALEGEFQRLKIFDGVSEKWIRDALMARAGILYVSQLHGRVHVEHTLPVEHYVDPRDARYGNPQCWHWARTIDKHVLVDQFKGRKADILAASDDDAILSLDDRSYDQATVDRVPLAMGWRLPSSPGAKDGRITIGIPGCRALYDGKWTHPWFPFEVLVYKPRLLGVWGVPIAEIVEGYQYEIEEVETSISEQVHMTAGGVILATTTSGISDSAFNNGIASVVRHRPGEAPQWINPEPVHPEKLNYRQQLRQDALQDSGISLTSARAQKPPGITAARALEHMADEQTQRFAPFERRFQAACVGLGEKMLATMRDIAEATGDYTVRYHQKRGAIDLSWTKDFALPEESYAVKVFATTLLSKRPEAKLQQLEQLVQTGMIDMNAFFRLSGFTDLEEHFDLELAGEDLVRDQVQAMLDVEDVNPAEHQEYPYPYGNLKYALKYAQLSWCLARREKCPPENLAMVETFIELIKAELMKLEPPPAPPPPVNDNGEPPPEEMAPPMPNEAA